MAASGGPEIGDLLGMGASITGCLLVGLGIGWLIDRGVGSFPVCTLIGLGLGILLACFYMYGQFKKFM